MIKKTNKNSNRKRLTKGGRVKAAKGFPNPTKEPMEKKPIRKPIPQAPRKPIQQGIPSKNTRNIDDPRGPIDTKLPEPVLRAPDNDNRARPRDEGGTGSITSQPVTTPTTLKKAPTTKKEQELNIGKTVEQVRTESQREATPVTPPTTFPRAPVQEDPRDSVVFAQTAQTAQQTASNEVIENLPSKLGFKFSQEELDKIAANVQAAIDEGILDLGVNQDGVPGEPKDGWWTTLGYGTLAEAMQSGEVTYKDGQWVAKDGTEDDAQKAIDEELITARGRAEQILQGDMEGVPQAEAPEEVEVGELGVAKTMEEREALIAAQAEVGAAPDAETIDKTATAKTPEELQAAQFTAEQVEASPDVEVAEGEVAEDALAKAAKVERVAPIEGVEVEIPEGALAERVVGTISEGAKATAVINAGSSLSRITRAKKQLSRAGLSDEDIKTIGNDPEDLEDRLADFSEEQRGIIEGLPEEALVSTQIDGLLQGMEDGEIPVWARPAVAQVEQMLARRGMSASTVGRDSLFNSIIQAAMPIAQSNAQAIQSSVAQQRNIEAQESEANAARGQQTALTNASNVFQMDMAQFSADQQTSLSNSKFMQTVAITNASNKQQAAVQNAVLMSQANLAEADFYQKAQINNANAFLQTDLTNLNNEQQANVLRAQQEQQRMLSNQSAINVAKQFNSTSENQTQQFMAGINAQVEQFNAGQLNNSAQFNAQQINARQAIEFQVEADLEKANAAMVNQINQFNEQTSFERDKFNTANAQQIEQSNLAWRRQANTINTAAANQVAMQNTQNAFNMTSQAQAFLWQELRDQADFAFRASEGEENRKAQLYATALANESDAAENWDSTLRSVGTLLKAIQG